MFKLKEPYIILTVGTPLSGKSTLIKKDFPEVNVICRDSIILELHGSNDYNIAFKEVNQKQVDKILRDRMIAASDDLENTILDMTHMSPKRRKYNLSYFPNHYKVAMVFPFLSLDEYTKRNEKRKVEENKNISWGIVENMMNSYQKPMKEEGFNKILFI